MRKKTIIIGGLFLTIIFFINATLMKNEPIKIGDTIPSFTLKDQNGNDFSINDYIGKSVLVIYFYPKDDTPGCTKEACSFRDNFQYFTDLNTKVIGISSDSVVSHKKFAEKYRLPFTLLADTKKEVRKLFGVPKFSGFIPGRVTYIIDKNGKIIFIFNSMRNAEKHIIEAKRIIQNME